MPSEFDLIVRGGKVVLPELSEPIEAEIAVADGRIAALLTAGTDASAPVDFDVAGRLVFPGAIDPHVHVSWPFLDSRTSDDYATASRAAAAGGTTTFLDFALEGRESPLAALHLRRAQAEGASVVDFSFHLVVSEASDQVLAELAEVVGEGVTSFKLYMTYRRRGLMVDDDTLFAVAKRAAELGAVMGVHAENGTLEEARLEILRNSGRGASRFFPELKPPFVEAEAVSRAARIAAAAGARLWILHVSSSAALEAALSARAEHGQPCAIETCPQYLLLDERALAESDGHRLLCSPPLRTTGDNQALWNAVADGSISWLGSDHCLFLAEQKDAHAERFWDCPHGLPGIQTRPGLFLHAALGRGLSPNRCAQMLSSSAAHWFGLYPRKGTLLPGSDADLVVWDPASAVQIANRDLSMGGDWTPYEQMPALAPPELVLSRGVPLIERGRMVAPDGHGAFLERHPSSSPSTLTGSRA